MGNAHPNIVPYQAFLVADGQIIIAVGNDAQFARLCEYLGMASVAADPHYATNAARVGSREQLLPLLASAGEALSIDRRASENWIMKLGQPCLPGD
jgi:crotonobetainyl-CoA:carnitine CoA-transferase CaiB-like acyl-CoA transferase